ncbi:MAG: TraR/DksA C4-type zinc finger protein [Deltaproteobacteria bacterium]|nr:TraR/DksA C4-type zinc finger protein [Deltaproteobacteria bacterium]
MTKKITKKKPVSGAKKPAVKKKTSTAAKTKSTGVKKKTTVSKKAVARKSAPKKAAPKKMTVKKAVSTPSNISQQKPLGKAAFIKQLKSKLLEDKKRILGELSNKIKNESTEGKFEMGDIYDIASSERERELTLTLGDRERNRLIEIEEALEHLADKDYGHCDDCGEPIGQSRLMALPFTNLCVDCKSKSERTGGAARREETPVGMLDKSEADDEEF